MIAVSAVMGVIVCCRWKQHCDCRWC